MKARWVSLLTLVAACAVLIGMAENRDKDSRFAFLGNAEDNSRQMLDSGKQIFRFDTFGDQAFWGDQLQLHEAVNGLSPRNALALGLKVDADALSPSTVEAIKHGKVNLEDPAVTRAGVCRQPVGRPRDRTEKTDRDVAQRDRLDRDAVAGKGPHAPVRIGERVRSGCAAVPRRRSCAGASADSGLPTAQVRQ